MSWNRDPDRTKSIRELEHEQWDYEMNTSWFKRNELPVPGEDEIVDETDGQEAE